MKKKWIIIIVALVIAIPVAYWLISPLFITKEVNESLDDLIEMAMEMEKIEEQDQEQGIKESGDDGESVSLQVPAPGFEGQVEEMIVVQEDSSDEPTVTQEPAQETPSQEPEPQSESQSQPEPEPEPEPTVSTVSSGSFTGLAGHNGSGTASLIKINGNYFVRFEDNFSVTNGPDLVVAFGSRGEYKSEAILGDLKGNQGGQNYAVPSSIDVDEYNEVWVWCRAFSVPFAKAELR